MKYIGPFLKYFSRFPIFTAKDVRLFMQKNRANEDYYKLFMHNLIRSGRAFKIKKGYYTLHDDIMAAGFAFSPFYYGLETALTHYNFWDYVTPISIITTRSARSGGRNVLERNVNIRRISKKMFFGYSMVSHENLFYIPVADIEKTLIDSVYFRALFNKEVYERMIDSIDIGKLERYLDHCPPIVRSRVKVLVRRYRQIPEMGMRENSKRQR